MKYLLDTNVISEWTKPRPDVSVVRWLGGAKEDDLFLSVITIGELWHGIERLPQGKRRAALAQWVEQDLSARFEERLLGIDERIARTWGVLLAASQQRGRAMHAVDALLAATADAYSLTLVTRNTKDFVASEIRVLNPFG
ncbi:MAG: PIN domain-containing protein [Acidobacteriaceae bacterium]